MSERLKILFITHSYPLSNDGLRGDGLSVLADALEEQGADVRVVAPDMKRHRKDREPQSQRLQLALPPSLREKHAPGSAEAVASRRATMRYLGAEFGSAVRVGRDFQPDVVHAHWWFPSGLVGSWVSSLASLPLITSLHGFDAGRVRKGSPTRPLLRHILRRSAAITVDSPTQAADVAAIHRGASPVIAPLPLSPAVFSASEERRGLVAVVPGFNGGGAVGTVAECLRALNDAGIEMVVVCSDRDEELARAAVAQAAVPVTLLPANRENRDQIGALFGSARCCVALGATDRERTTVTAAMLAGAAPVLLQSDKLNDLSDERHRIGFRLNNSTVEANLSELRQLLQNSDALAERGIAARMYALSALAPESCATRMLRVYNRALGQQTT